MELHLELKVCEGCGCLWYRIQTQGTVYCKVCEVRLRDFPTPASQQRRPTSRPRKSFRFHPAACTAGGGE